MLPEAFIRLAGQGRFVAEQAARRIDGPPVSRPFTSLGCAIELSQASRVAVYIPEGCAHGFQTLADDCELEYLITAEYVPGAARGVRWDDPALAVEWPIRTGIVMSERDRQLPSIEAADEATAGPDK